MAYNQYGNAVFADNVANRSSGAVRWQRGCSVCCGHVKPSGARDHCDGCQQCAGYDSHRRHALTPPTAHHRPQTAFDGTVNGGNTTTAWRWGMSWILIAVVLFIPVAFFITYIVAWQLGHADPILPFISDTGEHQPETGIFAELANIGAVIVTITFYVRYRQVAQYLPPSQLPHHVRVNKASFGIGVAVAFGLTLVANFPWGDMLVLMVLHTIGALMAFGLACVYMWMHVVLSFKTRPELSTFAVCYIRVVLASVASVMFIFTTVVNQSSLLAITAWAKASAACQWTMMTSIVLFILSYFDEFRYITIKAAVNVTDRKMSNPA